jgi:hypothetical protein
MATDSDQAQAGGFANPSIESLVMTFQFDSVDEYLQVVTDVTGWRRRVDVLSADDVSNLKLALTETVCDSDCDTSGSEPRRTSRFTVNPPRETTWQ